MTTLAVFQRLWHHLYWADQRSLDALEAAQAPLPAATRELAHVVGSAELWLSRMEGRPAQTPLWPEIEFPELQRLTERTHQAYKDFLTRLEPDSLSKTTAYITSDGHSFEDSALDILMHVALHSHYHRGKVNLLLRQAGGEPAPTDYIALVRGGPAATDRGSYILRQPNNGDLGWVIHRHGVLYNQEYSFNEEFEGLVAEIVAHFVRNFDANQERCWIAEQDGTPVGSVFLVRHPERSGVARLRLLLVEPTARGLGIGRHLVQVCTGFARLCGYRTITLYTNSILDAARRLYEEEGYEMVEEWPHHSYGQDLVAQTWELTL